MRRGKVEHARSQSGYLRQRRARGHRETIPLQDLPGGALHGYGRAGEDSGASASEKVLSLPNPFLLRGLRLRLPCGPASAANTGMVAEDSWGDHALACTRRGLLARRAKLVVARRWEAEGHVVPLFFFFFSRTLFCDQYERGPSAAASYGAYGALEAAALVPARIGEDLMQIRHGPLAQLGGRGQLEQRRRVGALSRDREHITGPSRDPG